MCWMPKRMEVGDKVKLPHAQPLRRGGPERFFGNAEVPILVDHDLRGKRGSLPIEEDVPARHGNRQLHRRAAEHRATASEARSSGR